MRWLLKFLVILLLFGNNMGLKGQSTTFQIVMDSAFILDFAVGQDSTIFILKAKKNFQNLNFDIGFVKLDKNGKVLQSRKIIFSDGHSFLLHGNKILTNKDGSFYLILHHFTSIETEKILIHFDKDFNVLHKLNNIVVSNNGNNYHVSENEVLKSRILWLPNIVFEPNTAFVQHNLTNDNYSFENYGLSNKQFTIILKDATFITNHSYLLHAESQNNNTEHYTLTKFNNITRENAIYRFNFDPLFIKSDNEKNLIILGKTESGEIIISKYTDELQRVWSKKVSISKKWSDYNFQKSLVIDKDGNIYINVKESIPELNVGTQLMKLDKNGNKIYHKLILDATHKGLNDAQFFDNHLLFSLGLEISSFLRKLPLSGEAEDCLNIPVCSEIEDFDTQIFKTDYGLVKIGETIPTDDYQISILPDDSKIYHYCEPFLPPDPGFAIFSQHFCVGDTLVIDTSQVYKYGISEWTIKKAGDAKTQVQKYPKPFVLDDSGQFMIQHKLFFGGCEYTYTIQIKVLDPINDQLPKTIEICENNFKTVSLPKNLATDILWNDGSVQNTLNIDKAGLYSVSYIDNNGCKKSESLIANQISAPLVFLGEDLTPCKDSLVVINLSKKSDETIVWSDSTHDFKKTIINDGKYMVTITNECGESSDDISIKYLDCSSTVQYSNIFSPNDDGINDQFVIYANNISEISIRFYDRWGNLVYSNDYQDGSKISWDGKYLQNPVISGVYVFVMEYKENISGKPMMLTGNTTVIY